MSMGRAQCAYARAVARLPRAGLMRDGGRNWCTGLGCASFGCDARRDEASKSADGFWRCTCAAALCTGGAQLKRRLGAPPDCLGLVIEAAEGGRDGVRDHCRGDAGEGLSEWCCARPALRHAGPMCTSHIYVGAPLEPLPDRRSRSQSVQWPTRGTRTTG
ncbi:MAG: hypothetical protein PPHEESC_6154 [uncultured Paraburkholderia sp.]|nr:MAG: hypothetical protein PPHEESC_6154 [uncultured Paraburkholderia sp.]CAH2945133.1 MAG: hypothetical protein PPHERAN_6210 [uncultured Paraburkholderia sp.]